MTIKKIFSRNASDIVFCVMATLEQCTGIVWKRDGHKLTGISGERALVLFSKQYDNGRYLFDLHANQIAHLEAGSHSFITFCFEGIREFVPIPFESVASNLKHFQSRVHPKSGKACWRIELRSKPEFGNIPVADWFKESFHYPFGYASVLEELGDYWRLRSGRHVATQFLPSK